MGTPDFAVPSLRALMDNGYNVVGVFCQPDRPKGRGHKLAACPVKEAAVGAGITSLLLFLTLKKIHAIDARNEVRRRHAQREQDKGGASGNA